jgi:hypothetical protein
VIDKSDLQYEKQNEPWISTWLGIKIDWSDEDENANDSSRAKSELDPNVIDESDSEHEKHIDPRISRLLGIKIDWSDEDENANDSNRVKSEFDSNAFDHNQSFFREFENVTTWIKSGIHSSFEQFSTFDIVHTIFTDAWLTYNRRISNPSLNWRSSLENSAESSFEI